MVAPACMDIDSRATVDHVHCPRVDSATAEIQHVDLVATYLNQIDRAINSTIKEKVGDQGNYTFSR